MNADITNHDSLDEALSTLVKVVRHGLQHGYFGCQVHIEVIKGGKRQLRIEAGNMYQFVIAPEDLQG